MVEVASPDIVVVGSANMDLVVRVDRLPLPGETILGKEFWTAPGGKGANQAVAAARLEARVTMVGHLGSDAFGDQLAAGLEREGINLCYLQRDPGVPSGVALIAVGPRGENFIIVAPGANANVGPMDVDQAGPAIDGADCLLVQLEIPQMAVERAVERASRAGAMVVLNPAPARPLSRELLEKVDVLTPDESEAALLSGCPVGDLNQAQVAAEALLRQGVRAVVLTLGAEGALVASPDVCEHVPAFPVVPVDTTAAGDAFNAALAVALASGLSLVEAARFANAAGALATTALGAQPSLPRLADVQNLLNSSY